MTTASSFSNTELLDKISSSALLCNLTLRRYNHRKTDKAESRKVNLEHKIRKLGAGAKVTKNTLPTADILERIEKHYGKIRRTVDSFCAPYSRGIGLLPSTSYIDLRVAVLPLFDECTNLVKLFAEEYENYQAQARVNLNGLFKPEDYPPVAKILSKFSHSLDIYPVPDAQSLRLKIVGDVADSIQAAVNDTIQTRAEGLVPYFRESLLEPLVKLSATLQNPEANGFQDSLVSNVIDAATRVAGLNIVEDDEIRNACYGIQDKLNRDPRTLKDSPGDRAIVCSDAGIIIELLGGTIPAPIIVGPKKPRAKRRTKEEILAQVDASQNNSPALHIQVEGEPTDDQINAVADAALVTIGEDILKKYNW